MTNYKTSLEDEVNYGFPKIPKKLFCDAWTAIQQHITKIYWPVPTVSLGGSGDNVRVVLVRIGARTINSDTTSIWCSGLPGFLDYLLNFWISKVEWTNFVSTLRCRIVFNITPILIQNRSRAQQTNVWSSNTALYWKKHYAAELLITFENPIADFGLRIRSSILLIDIWSTTRYSNTISHGCSITESKLVRLLNEYVALRSSRSLHAFNCYPLPALFDVGALIFQTFSECFRKRLCCVLKELPAF